MSSPPGFLREASATLALAVPMSTGQMGQMLLGFSDSIMVGRLRVIPLAACAFANNVLNIFFVAGLGLVGAISILAAQAHGANRPREAGEALRHALAIAVGTSLVIIAAVYAGEPFLHLLSAPAEVREQSRPFLIIVSWSILPALAWQCLKQYCEALSHPIIPMAAMLGTVVLNIVLSWILIYGHWGAPALGLTGAALATLIARIVLLICNGLLILRARRFRDALPLRWFAPLTFDRLWAQLAIGFPIAAQLLLEVGAFAFGAIMMGWLGAVPLAAHQIAITYAALTFMVPLGVGMAVSVRVGQAVGAGAWARVRTIGLGGVAMAASIMCVAAAVFVLAGDKLAAAVVRDALTSALAAQLLGVAAVFQIFDGAQVAFMGALRGLTDIRIPTTIAFFSYWLIALPLGYTLAFVLRRGPVGVWWGLALGLAISAFLLGGRFLLLTRVGRPHLTNLVFRTAVRACPDPGNS